jgi:hypothetical protein
MSRIISFRGLIEDGGIDTVPLQTNKGLIGYKIVELQIMPKTPGVGDVDHILQVFSVEQTTASATVNFSAQQLLGAAFFRQDANYVDITGRMGSAIIFDNVTFNQDIYVTLKNARGNAVPCNYLIKLEQMKLDLSEQSVATLKDIRNVGAQ